MGEREEEVTGGRNVKGSPNLQLIDLLNANA